MITYLRNYAKSIVARCLQEMYDGGDSRNVYDVRHTVAWDTPVGAWIKQGRTAVAVTQIFDQIELHGLTFRF